MSKKDLEKKLDKIIEILGNHIAWDETLSVKTRGALLKALKDLKEGE